MKLRKPSLNEAQVHWVREWWRALQPKEENAPPVRGALAGFGRAERARVRRCATLDELLAESAVLTFADGVIRRGGAWSFAQDPAIYQHLAWMAGVLAWVKSDRRDGRVLAGHLRAAAGAARAPMSELRFRRLMRSVMPQELYLQWQRAVRLVAGSVDVGVLADDLLTWLIQLKLPAARAEQAVRFCWSHAYYLDARAQTTATDPVESLNA